MGLRPRWGDDLFARDGFLAGDDARRRAEWERAWRDPEVRAVIVARGGAGSYRLLPTAVLDEAVKQPRIFCGFSDPTFLHAELQTRRLVTFYGPMVAWDLAKGAGQPGGYDGDLFERLLLRGEPGGTLVAPGALPLRAGVAEGRLAGGCLSLISATLGTAEAPDFDGAIVVLEDEKETPYRLDRFLHHLRRAGAFRAARGIALGDFPQCEAEHPGTPSARQVIADFFSDFEGPVVWGFPIGHTAGINWTVPLGTWARLDGDGAQLEMLEPAVAD